MIKKYIMFSLALALLWTACSERELDPVFSPSENPVLTAPSNGQSFVITEETLEEQFGVFTWMAPSVGFDAAPIYTVEMDVTDGSFMESSPVVGTLDGLSLTVMNDVLNNELGLKGIPPDVASDIYFRVKAELTSEVILYSEPITLEIVPFAAPINYSFLHVPGSYQGWNPADSSTIVFARSGGVNYDGYIYFNDPGALYKFTDGPSWDNNWGDNEPDGILDPGGIGNDIPINDGAGMYYLTADLNSLEHTNERRDWGIVGDATPGGWDNDTPMEWDDSRKVLSVTADMTTGFFKFRANNNWDVNFGDTFNNGRLSQDGGDISIDSDGNYTIDLIITVGDYTYTVTKN